MLKVLDTALCSLPTPTPTISVMGDFNLPVSAVKWLRNDEGLIMPLVANHRENETLEGKQDRLQAQHLVEFASKHNLIQQVDKVTHGTEILDLIFTNDHELISNIEVADWPQFTDHKVVTASVTYQDKTDTSEQEETHLLDVGRRFSRLDFNKAPWEEIKTELNLIDWTSMEQLTKVDP